jgi:hypothetical protein
MLQPLQTSSSVALSYSREPTLSDDRKSTWQQEFEFLREQVQTQASEGYNSSTNAVAPTQEFDDGV